MCDEVLVDAIDDAPKVTCLCITHEAVHIDGDDLCTACDDAARTEGVAKSVVGKLVAETAAGRKTVYAVRHIDKEAVSFLHLSRTVVAEVLIGESFLRGEEAGGEDREGQKFPLPLLAEPLHEEELQVPRTHHVNLCAVGVIEAAEHFCHVGAVEDADVPKDGLIRLSLSFQRGLTISYLTYVKHTISSDVSIVALLPHNRG